MSTCCRPGCRPRSADFFYARGFPGDGFAYPADPAEACDRLAAEGITEAWSLPYARRPGSAADLNQAMARFAAAHADGAGVKVIGGCTVHPADGQPARLVRTAVEDLGLRVLKLHCSVGDFRPDDRRLDPVWEYVSAVALPVVLHAGHAPDGHTEAAELAPVATVARRHPEARIIIAHCGHAASDVALRLVAEHPGVHADLTPVLHQPVRPPGRAGRGGRQGAVRLGRAQHRADRDRAAGRAGRCGRWPDRSGAGRRIAGGTALRLLDEVQAYRLARGRAAQWCLPTEPTSCTASRRITSERAELIVYETRCV